MSQQLYDVIARRRDVRAEFSGDDLDQDALRRVLYAAHQAPSVGHSQPWDFVLVKDEVKRREFAEHVETERKVFADQLDGERRATFEKIKVEGIRESGLGVVVTYSPDRGGQHVLGRHAIADAGLYSTCLAIQNLWLSATAEGLGVGWVSFYREEFLADLIGLPDGVRPVAWLCLGPITRLQEVPDLVRHDWRKGRTLDEAIHHDSWSA
ncbi:5,6-dimethylbenzimidazole synthase [Nocardioides hwasunensis]|uniref:5,6-dimethylbenzimidazole synthase n=1 Tax=Nocardioides hwasunensis TaxID=397258 RepID=A0ABR8MNW2_9ACTN|nr:5,6-dimethylbenzimidazole synthase [Nocardioides hwasunensis]MBD3916507.1 5,6-dimethylbenzimidazole synthase [Nocardioides hwasunensis]